MRDAQTSGSRNVAAHVHRNIRPVQETPRPLDKWISAAADYAKPKNFDPGVFPTSRLAPNQFALERQAQMAWIACDTVKLDHSHLTNKAAQPQENNEKDLAERQPRVPSITTLLDAVTAKISKAPQTKSSASRAGKANG